MKKFSFQKKKDNSQQKDSLQEKNSSRQKGSLRKKEVKEPKRQMLFFGIRNKVFACFLIPILFMVIVGTMAYQKAARGMNGQFQESTLQTLHMASEYIEMSGKFIETEGNRYAFDSTLDKYYLGLMDNDQFSRSEAVKSVRANMMSAKTTNPFISNIHIVTQEDVEMLSTFSTTNEQGLTEKRMGNLKEYRETMSTDGKKLPRWVDNHKCLDDHISLEEKDYILSFQTLSNQKSAIIVIDVKPEAIGEFLKGLDLGEGSIVGFVTENGREIVCRDGEKEGEKVWSQEESVFYGQDFYSAIGENEDTQAADAQSELTIGSQEVKYNGEAYLFLYSRNPVNNTTICTLVPQHVVTGQAEDIKKLTLTLVLLAALIAGVIGIVITAGIQKNMKKISHSLGRVADGDLTVQVKTGGRDEFKGLADSATNMIHKNRKLVVKVNDATVQLEASAREVKNASEIISGYSEEITSSINGINEGMGRQSANAQVCVEQTTTLSGEIGEVQEIIGRVELLVGETEEMIDRGMSLVQALGDHARETNQMTAQVGRSIEELKEESEAIGRFVGIIADIAQQTNLLSLNASIEAARAGEAGRGFGVVAEEIRKLADNSAGAAREIKNNVEHVAKHTQSSVKSAQKAEEMVALQTQAVEEVIGVFQDMNSHMSRLIGGLKEIASRMEEADHKRGDTLDSVQSISGIIEDTAESTGMVSDVIRRLSDSVKNLNSISDTLDQNMGELKTEIALFKISE